MLVLFNNIWSSKPNQCYERKHSHLHLQFTCDLDYHVFDKWQLLIQREDTYMYQTNKVCKNPPKEPSFQASSWPLSHFKSVCCAYTLVSIHTVKLTAWCWPHMSRPKLCNQVSRSRTRALCTGFWVVWKSFFCCCSFEILNWVLKKH